MGSEQPEQCHGFVCLKSTKCLIKAGSLNAPGDSNVNSRYLKNTDRGWISKVTAYIPYILSLLCALA